MQLVQTFSAIDRNVQVLDQPVLEPIAPAMQSELVAPRPVILQHSGVCNVDDLLNGIEFSQHIVPPFRGGILY